MGRSSLQGTPWHYEYLKKGDGERRNKKKCIYYKNGKCEVKILKCTGTGQCEFYKEINVHKNNKIDFSKLIIEKQLNNKIEKNNGIDFIKLFKSTGKKYKGLITVKIENEQPRRYKTSEIPNDALLFDEAYKHSVGESFKLCGYTILLIKKNLEKR